MQGRQTDVHIDANEQKKHKNFLNVWLLALFIVI